LLLPPREHGNNDITNTTNDQALSVLLVLDPYVQLQQSSHPDAPQDRTTPVLEMAPGLAHGPPQPMIGIDGKSSLVSAPITRASSLPHAAPSSIDNDVVGAVPSLLG
jgi:hypothetical protein